jgi:hypothetical protein
MIFVLCCLMSSGREVWDAQSILKSPARSNSPAIHADERFAAIKGSLPERGVIGYIGEPGALALGDYYAAQYALAPLVVEHSAKHPLVIGNFPSAHSSPPSTADDANLRLIRDFGDGVLLFANKGTR